MCLILCRSRYLVGQRQKINPRRSPSSALYQSYAAVGPDRS
ncbi:hypothetical protein [Microcoleus anatoxicus]